MTGLLAAACPAAVIVDDATDVLSAQDRRVLVDLAARTPRLTYREVAGAAHHVMFDRPGELLDTIATVVSPWLDA